MSRSPALTGMPAAPMVTQPGAESKVMADPSGKIDPFGQDGPVIGLRSNARVLSAYMMVIMSVAGPVVPSGLFTVGPKPLPGSMAGRITLHPLLAELGPSKVSFNTAGGRLTRLALLLQPEAVLFGMVM